MPPRGRNKDVPRSERLATRSKCGRQWPRLAQNLVERGRRLGCKVNGNKDRSRKIRRKPRGEKKEGLNPTGGGADGHDVAIGHGLLRSRMGRESNAPLARGFLVWLQTCPRRGKLLTILLIVGSHERRERGKRPSAR